MAQRRGYLLVALWGLVVAGLFAALAAYLAVFLVLVLWGMLRDPANFNLGAVVLGPFFLVAAVLPFWAVNLFWQVLEMQPANTAQRTVLRRSGLRLLRWTFGIYLCLVLAMVGLAWPDLRAEQLIAPAAFAGIGLFATLPLILLLTRRSPLGPNRDHTVEPL